MAVNLTLNVFLAPVYGLYGIAVAVVVGSACSSGYLVAAMRRLCGLNWEQVLLLNGSWLTMVGLAAGVAFLSMLGMLAAQWHVWQQGSQFPAFQSVADSKGVELAAYRRPAP